MQKTIGTCKLSFSSFHTLRPSRFLLAQSSHLVLTSWRKLLSLPGPKRNVSERHLGKGRPLPKDFSTECLSD